MNQNFTPAKPTAAQIAGREALAALKDSVEVHDLLARLTVAQGAQEADGSWDSRIGRRTEDAAGCLRMALEAAGAHI